MVLFYFKDNGLFLGILLSTKNTRQSVAYSGYQGPFFSSLFLLHCTFLALFQKVARLGFDLSSTFVGCFVFILPE